MLSADGNLDNLDAKDLNLESRVKVTLAPPSRVIKIMNLVDPAQAKFMVEREFKRVFDDIVYEVAKHIEIEHCFIIKMHNSTIGAEPGSVFLITKNKDDSVKVGIS